MIKDFITIATDDILLCANNWNYIIFLNLYQLLRKKSANLPLTRNFIQKILVKNPKEEKGDSYLFRS